MKGYIPMLVIVLTSFCQGECPIECFCDRVTTCMGDKLLTRFPTQSPLGFPLLRLELHDYSVTHLSRQDFLQIISNLTEISISRNSLETFDNDTFSLHQSGTREDLDFLQLRILDLSQNKLKYFVGGGKLKKVKILDLSSNELQQVYELSAIQNLESVNLRNNRIAFLAANIFQNLRNLQYVNLDSNVLGILDPSTFSNLPSLAHLILSSNPISSNLLPGFYWNSRVQFVDVSSTGLTKIPSSLTKTVRDFRCANNNLTIIRQTDFESYPNVGLLVLDENNIEIVEDDAFGRLDFLARLWINGNRLKRIPQNLPPSLRSLQLESNLIANLTVGDFKNLRTLEELNLHGNRITSVPPLVFAELGSLKTLDLRSNLIDVIYRDSFNNLSKLETLDLSQNPVKVIVSGAFSAFRKLTLLHLSRWFEPVEFDVKGSFKSLQNLQIFEVDNSPHLVQKLFQDNAFSYMENIIELNVQWCGLEDLNLISNTLIDELPDLRTVKMNGNPWDCEDLQGSGIHELMSRLVVVDDPKCAHPPSLKTVRLSNLNTSQSVNLPEGKNPTHHSSLVTRTGGDSLSGEHFPLATAPPDRNINSLGKEPAGKSEIVETTSNSSMTKPRVAFKKAFPKVADAKLTSTNTTTKGTASPFRQTTKANSLDLIDDGGGDAIPTQSYFDSSDKDDVSGDVSNKEGTNPRIPILKTKPGAPRWKSSKETKTNDDNAIIDESSGRREQEQGSIDGFPLSADNTAKEASSNDAPSASNPKYSYLKLQDNTRVLQSRGKLPMDSTSSTTNHLTVILKTLVLSALTCLVAILVLFLISLFVYRFTQKRTRIPFPCARRCSKDEEEDDTRDMGRMLYTRFDRGKPRDFSSYRGGGAGSRIGNQHRQESDSDQVELSGITNSLYFENEDIYHIT